MDFEEVALRARYQGGYTTDEANTEDDEAEEQQDAIVEFEISEKGIPCIHGKKSEKNTEKEKDSVVYDAACKGGEGCDNES